MYERTLGGIDKLYDIDLLPLRKCILGIHLIAEFAEQAMLQEERDLSLNSSLCLWRTRNDAEIITGSKLGGATRAKSSL